MTLFQVEELASYWAQHPPLHLLISAYLGVSGGKHVPLRPVSAGETRRSSSDIASMLSRLGPGFSAGDVHAGLSPVILDFTELDRRANLTD